MSDLRPLANLTTLERLRLSGTQVSDIDPLANLIALEWLVLDNTQVSDISPLAKLTALGQIDLRGTHVSIDAIEELRTSRPDLHITIESSKRRQSALTV